MELIELNTYGRLAVYHGNDRVQDGMCIDDRMSWFVIELIEPDTRRKTFCLSLEWQNPGWHMPWWQDDLLWNWLNQILGGRLDVYHGNDRVQAGICVDDGMNWFVIELIEPNTQRRLAVYHWHDRIKAGICIDDRMNWFVIELTELTTQKKTCLLSLEW